MNKDNAFCKPKVYMFIFSAHTKHTKQMLQSLATALELFISGLHYSHSVIKFHG